MTMPPLSAATGDWHIAVTPYLWDLTMAGQAAVGVNETSLERTKWGGMLNVEVHKNQFGIFVNGIYSRMSESKNYGFFQATVTNIFGIFTGGLSYDVTSSSFQCVSQICALTLQPYVGARYTTKETKLSLSGFFMTSDYTHDQHWTDPIIGINANLLIAREWLLQLGGDIGGTNRNSQYSYKALGLLGYQPKALGTHVTFYAGYQILDQHYVDGINVDYFNWNMKLYGPLVGLSLSY